MTAEIIPFPERRLGAECKVSRRGRRWPASGWHRTVLVMEAPEHEWVDHGRWRQCVRCGQKQFMPTSRSRSGVAFSTSTASSRWLPAEPEPCVQQDGDDQRSRRRAILTASLRRKFPPKPKSD
jgi:hypothetical protein